jgi:hypothetical protein
MAGSPSLAGRTPGRRFRSRRCAFDDRQHVDIQTAAALAVSKAPTLLVESCGGEAAFVDHQVGLPHAIVGWPFDAAVLIVGVGCQRDRATIRRKAAGQ